MTNEEIIKSMVNILQEKGEPCLESELLDALKTNGIEISKTHLDDIIANNPTIFSRTPEVKKDEKVIQESGVRLAGVDPMPESVTNNTIKELPTKKVGLPPNQNKNRRK